MKTISKLSELRKEIKPIGFNIETKSYSFGKSATYVHLASGEKLTYNVFTAETLEIWKPLFDVLKKLDIKIEGITGLKNK